MKQKVANYTVIIEKEKRTGNNQPCFTAFVPLLGIATEADTLSKVKNEIQSLVEFHLESLAEEGEEIPIERKHPLITHIEASLPQGNQFIPS